MKKDFAYTNGVIAVRETRLLRDKTERLIEMSAEEGLRFLRENGFGAAFEGGVHAFEDLAAAEEAELDAFVREYAPSEAAVLYYFLPRDFHNAKALIKAKAVGADGAGWLAPEGTIPLSELRERIETRRYGGLSAELSDALTKAEELLAEKEVSGTALGALFERALCSALGRRCKKSSAAAGLLARRTDMINLLTCFRAGDPERAKPLLLPCGTLREEQLARVFERDAESVSRAFEHTPYRAFVESCLSAREKGAPYTAAERMRDRLDTEYFAERRFELRGEEPFYYYVFRRRAEIADVRIFFVCRLAGMSAAEIGKRLRSV